MADNRTDDNVPGSGVHPGAGDGACDLELIGDFDTDEDPIGRCGFPDCAHAVWLGQLHCLICGNDLEEVGILPYA